MKKKTLTLILFFMFNVGYSFQSLSHKQLLDTANHYAVKNNIDTALIYYNLVVENPTSAKDDDDDHQIRVITALNKMAIIYMNMSDYRNAYKHLINALLLCEKYNILSEQSRIYNNLGNIYYHFKKYDIAKMHYYRALDLCEDSVSAGYYNNLGQVLSELGKTDSAFYFFDKSLQICRQYNNDRLFALYNSIASLYQKTKQYDSAFYYYHLSSQESRKNNKIEHEAQNLSDLGKLFLENKQMDSALFYINLSNQLAEENSFLKILVENNLVLSKIEESKGRMINAFGYYKKYADLQDSVFNTSIWGDINQVQHFYEIFKTNQKIEQLVVKQEIRKRTIFITSCILVLVSTVLLYIYLQNRKLRKAYNALVEKNLEIKKYQEKDKKEDLSYGAKDELFDKILAIMEETPLICEPDFSIDKLAIAVKSNHTYVSRAIKNATNKPFRSFLNNYRIREAQRIFSEPDTVKYTIESVALRVGFKSRNAFHDVFKEITGVSPNFYLKSVQEHFKAQNE